MELPKKKKQSLNEGNCLWKMFFLQSFKVIIKGNRKTFEMEDLWEVDPDYQYQHNHQKLDKYYQQRKRKRSLFWILAGYISKTLMLQILASFTSQVVLIAIPYILRMIINELEQLTADQTQSQDKKWLYIYILLLLAVLFVRHILYEHGVLLGYKASAVTQSSIYSLVFEKLATIDLRSFHFIDLGSMINNITTNVKRVHISVATCRQIVNAPLLMIIFTVILIVNFGVHSLLGIVIVFLILIMIYFIGAAIGKQNLHKLESNGLRNSEISFALAGIKSIKFNCWEDILSQRINTIRKTEHRPIFIINFLRNLSDVLILSLPAVSAFSVIVLYNSLEPDKLSLGNIFFILTIFGFLVTPLKQFFVAFSNITQVVISIGLVQDMLDLPDMESQENNQIKESEDVGELIFEAFTASYRDRKYDEQIFQLIAKKKSKSFKEFDKNHIDYEPVLRNISFTVGKGELIMVVGPVGSGKSSLLKSLMGSLHTQAGSIQYSGKIGYVSQESFLINNRFRENILFGKEFEKERYYQTVSLTELESDILSLRGGEFAEIGEKGINLSGGQKQRISLARAYYADCDIYLIDDSLSALDAHVGHKIFFNLFLGEMVAKGKTVIMTTHVLTYLNHADQIIFLEKGQIAGKGSFEEIKKSNFSFNEFILSNQQKSESNQQFSKASIKDIKLSRSQNSLLQNRTNCTGVGYFSHNFNKFDYESAIFNEFPTAVNGPLPSRKIISNHPNNIQKIQNKLESGERIKNKKSSMTLFGQSDQEQNVLVNQQTLKGKLVKKERKEKGKVHRKIFWKYFSSGGVCFFLIILFFFFLTIAVKLGADYWVSLWTSQRLDLSERWYINLYAIFLGVLFLVGIIRAFLWGFYSVKISEHLFQQLFRKIIIKPMSYFDVTPSGQLLNLMGKDMDIIDIFLSLYSNNTLDGFFRLIGIFVIATVANVFLLPLIVVLLLVFFLFISKYLKVSREIRRLELINTSSIISRCSELYKGLEIFRSFDQIDSQRQIYRESVDLQISLFVHYRVMIIMVFFLSGCLMMVFIISAILLVCTGFVDSWPLIPSDISFVSATLNWILLIPNMIDIFMFFYVLLVQTMGSVERVTFNVHETHREGQWKVGLPKLTNHSGLIEVKNIYVRYRPGLPFVLNGLSLKINPSEKVALVGRTGSGKSSFLLALTRILNVENSQHFIKIAKMQGLDLSKNEDEPQIQSEGWIKVNGHHVDEIGLHDLRKMMAVIPQDSFILKGTLKLNIDPLNELSDQEVYDAIVKFRLSETLFSDKNEQEFETLVEKDLLNSHQNFQERKKTTIKIEQSSENEISNLRSKILNYSVEEGGKNLSVGQKQLICIIRALIRNPSILLMDEATSNIDEFTDQVVQNIIKHQCENTTVVTIAHRLKTVAHYDRIFVLSNGRIKEQGSFKELISQKGELYSMVKDKLSDFKEFLGD